MSLIEQLEREFAKLESEHTAIVERMHEAANKRIAAWRKLRVARSAPAGSQDSPVLGVAETATEVKSDESQPVTVSDR